MHGFPNFDLYRFCAIEVNRADDKSAVWFWLQVVGMTDELDQLTGGSVKKATPALTRRQKDIFKC